MKYAIQPDVAAGKLRILATGKTPEQTGVEEKPFHETPFSPEFYAEIKTLLAEYFAKDPAFRASFAALVLPDEAVGIDLFRLPNVSRPRMQQAYEAELSNLYGAAAKEKKIDRFVVKKNKQYTAYGAVCYDKTAAAEFYRILTSLRLLPRGTTFASAATLACAGANSLKYHGKTFLFANVRGDRTDVCLSFKGRPLGICRIPYGENLLSFGKVVDEYQITDHLSAELAVRNAKERARATSFTTFSEMQAEMLGEEPALPEGAPDGTDAVEETAGLRFYRKPSKRGARALQKATPASQEETERENFRILQKWLLLYARRAEHSADLPKPEFILINLPEKFYPMLEKVNEEQKASGGVAFLPFIAWDKSQNEKQYPELFGAFAALKQEKAGFFPSLFGK